MAEEEEEEFGCAENQNHQLFKRHQTHHSDYIFNAMTAQKNDGFFAGERPGNRDADGESARPASEFSSPVSWDAFFRVNNMVGSSELVFQEGVTEQRLVGREVVAAEVRNLAAETESDEFDCESEEGQEAVEELTKSAAAPPATSSSSRNGSKRSRAAEVHNLSEKRRRSRINEKMKALQNLIPNANKTDKASMLDEAIEYLKQLQLQVQMLSMKNGLYLPHMYMSGALQQFQVPLMCVDFGTTANSSLPVNMAAGLMPVNQNASSLLFPQCTSSLQSQAAMGTTASDAIPSTFCIDSSQPHLRPNGFPMASEDIYRANVSSHEGLDIVRNIDITATKTQHLLMKDVDNLRASN